MKLLFLAIVILGAVNASAQNCAQVTLHTYSLEHKLTSKQETWAKECPLDSDLVVVLASWKKLQPTAPLKVYYSLDVILDDPEIKLDEKDPRIITIRSLPKQLESLKRVDEMPQKGIAYIWIGIAQGSRHMALVYFQPEEKVRLVHHNTLHPDSTTPYEESITMEEFLVRTYIVLGL